MALQIEIVPFTIRTPAGAGTQTVSLIRYPTMTPKGIIFILASNSGTNGESFSLGLDDGTTHLGAGVAASIDPFNAGALRTARSYSTQYSLVTSQAQVFFGAVDTRLKGYVSAVSVGSFDLTLDLNNTPGAQWYAIVIGGDGVSCATGLYDMTAGSGTATVGFDPVALIKLGVPDAAFTGQTSGANLMWGFATPCGPEQVGFGIDATAGSNAADSYQLDGTIQANITAGSTTISEAVTVSAYPSNGFSVTGTALAVWNIGYLAIGGSAVSANLVSLNQPTTTGIQNTTITATNPVAAFFGSTCKIATAGAGRADANLSFGVYDGNDTISQWWGHVNATVTRDRLSSVTKAIMLATATGASTSTVNAEASATLASTNLALNWTTADATQREVWALILADNLSGSTNNCGVNSQASITVNKVCTPIAGGETLFPFSSAGLTPSSFNLMDGESQLFASVTPGTYNISESAPDGWSVSYASSNGSPHTALTVGSGEAVTLTATNTFLSTSETVLRLRRWALPYDGNKQIFIPRIEIVSQMGVGNADDPEPVMYLRISPDGGSNFGPFRRMPLGADGDTMIRSYLTRFGQLRNPVAELVCNAPVFVAWIRCELPQGFTVGSS